MQRAIGSETYDILKIRNIQEEQVLETIRKFASDCRTISSHQPIVYYSGYAEIRTGNWCFSDGTIQLIDVKEIFEYATDFLGNAVYPLIVSDACYSGAWANKCFCLAQQGVNIYCLSSCREFQTACNTTGLSLF